MIITCLIDDEKFTVIDLLAIYGCFIQIYSMIIIFIRDPSQKSGWMMLIEITKYKINKGVYNINNYKRSILEILPVLLDIISTTS